MVSTDNKSTDPLLRIGALEKKCKIAVLLNMHVANLRIIRKPVFCNNNNNNNNNTKTTIV